MASHQVQEIDALLAGQVFTREWLLRAPFTGQALINHPAAVGAVIPAYGLLPSGSAGFRR